jgi:hypothetical protein
MADYYTSDITERPYSTILSDAELNWRFRLEVVLRKFFRWHFPAAHGRAPPTKETVVPLEQLPQEVRAGITAAIDELRQYGFHFVAVNRSNSVGAYIAYSGMFVNEARTTVWSILARRIALNTESSKVWVFGLRSYLQDGTVLVTGRQVDQILSYSQPKDFQFELFPESTPTAEVVQRHFDRLRAVPNAEIVRVPSGDVVEYLLERARTDFQAALDYGFYRKLTETEVARLREIEFEFV